MKAIAILLMLVSTWAPAQNAIDKILADVSRNNKTLISNNQYKAAQTLSYKTGLTPDNPRVEFEYLPGRPEGAGTQRDLVVSQAFDFPTVYGNKSKVSEAQILKTDLEMQVQRQEILLQAKQLCLEIIYRNKLNVELTKRYEHVLTLSRNFQTRAERGAGNILDVNKANLQLLAVKTERQVNDTERNKALHKLAELNGGLVVSLQETLYPVLPSIPVFEALDSLIEANDPLIKAYEQETALAKAQLGLTKSLRLPKLEAGYHAQSILGQQYQGPRVAVTLPLWENKNRVQAQASTITWSELQVNSHRTEHRYYNRQLYEHYVNFRQIYEEYAAVLPATNSDYLLGKAFEKGEISSIEYFMELSYFYSAVTQSLTAEFELQKSVAALFKFQL